MLKVKKLFQPGTSIGEAEAFFSSSNESEKIDCVNWNDFPYKPDVHFKIAHSGTGIYLQYIVREKYIRAQHVKDNDSVWTDSCVEFFFSPAGDGAYYNIEFNCIGTALLGFGDGKTHRERAGAEITSKIIRMPTFGNKAIEPREGDFTWQLTVSIPIEVFYRHKLEILSGLKAGANFYKCGDELKEPHYLSWKPIEFVKPNFHLPQYFGQLLFE